MRGRPTAALCYLAALLTPCGAEMLLLDEGAAGAITILPALPPSVVGL